MHDPRGDGAAMDNRADLVRRVCEGDMAAFDAVVQRYQDMAVGYAYSLLGDFHLAQDAAQDAFVQAFLRLPQLREPQAFPGWFKTVVFTCCNRITRRKQLLFAGHDGLAESAYSSARNPNDEYERVELNAVIAAAMDTLGDEQRTVLILHYISGYSHVEIASFLGLTATTVNNRLHSARAALKKELLSMVEDKVRNLGASGDKSLARRVIEDVMRLTYEPSGGRGMFTPFCGAVLAVMKRLGVRTDYDFIAATSGAAFRMVWKDGWHLDNSRVMYMDASPFEPVQRAFDALGYEYSLRMGKGFAGVWPVDSAVNARFSVSLSPERDQAVEEIKASIDNGIPVIAWGIVGPPEPCVLTGYDDGGNIIIGTSYFQDDSAWRGDVTSDVAGYFRKAGWFDAMLAYIIIGQKKRVPENQQLYLDSLRRAVRVARAATVNDRHGGLAAFDALAAQLAADDLSGLDLPALWNCFTSYLDALIMPHERGSAAAYLRRIAADVPDWAPELERAAAFYSLVERSGKTPWKHLRMNDDGARKFADRSLRRLLANDVTEAREHEEQAVALIESLLGRCSCELG
ncbi:MAG: sigma-70 family RNA polymerase sigma factor [Bacillota bacterium]